MKEMFPPPFSIILASTAVLNLNSVETQGLQQG